MTNHEKLLEFHEKFGVHVGKIGHIPGDDRAMLRTRLIIEEVAELIEAMQMRDYPEIASELADVLYVVYGTAVEYGIPMDKVFAELHRANMTKTGDKDKGGKIKKGPDYVKHDVPSVLSKALKKENRK